MSDACLVLTAYFGERKRVGGRFVADAVLDVFSRHRTETSVLLRGMEGFGLRHHLRTDTSLSLSEDLPAVAIAVDTRPRIEDLLAEVSDAVPSGTVTLERARLESGELTAITLPERLHESTRLTLLVGRHERATRGPAFVAICDLLYREGIAGATALLGVDGTRRGQRQRARFVGRNAAVPVVVTAVGSGERIARALPELGALVESPVLTLERVRVCKRDGASIARPHVLPMTDERGVPVHQKLTVYTSESQLHDARPVHREITRRLRAAGVSGSTTLRGIWGFHGDARPHGDHAFGIGRHVPVVTTVIDAPDRIATAFAIIDELTDEHGLVTSEMVPALLSRSGTDSRGALVLADHDF